MFDAQRLADQFETSLRAERMQADGLTRAISLMQLPFRGNCMNWTPGFPRQLAGRNDRAIQI
jgi:hypothetical protein